MNFNKAAIFLPWSFAHQSVSLGALDEPDNGIVPPLHELGEFRDCGPATARIALHSQHELVLLGGDSTSAGHALAEAKETPYPVAKPRQTPHRLGL